jgi:hypothetical protein
MRRRRLPALGRSRRRRRRRRRRSFFLSRCTVSSGLVSAAQLGGELGPAGRAAPSAVSTLRDVAAELLMYARSHARTLPAACARDYISACGYVSSCAHASICTRSPTRARAARPDAHACTIYARLYTLACEPWATVARRRSLRPTQPEASATLDDETDAKVRRPAAAAVC